MRDALRLFVLPRAKDVHNFISVAAVQIYDLIWSAHFIISLKYSAGWLGCIFGDIMIFCLSPCFDTPKIVNTKTLSLHELFQLHLPVTTLYRVPLQGGTVLRGTVESGYSDTL